MVTCRRCGSNCDNGELVGGICPECLEEEDRQQIQTRNIARMINGPYHQMKLNLEVNAYAGTD